MNQGRVEVISLGKGRYTILLPDQFSGDVTLHCVGGSVQRVHTGEWSRPDRGTIELIDAREQNRV